MAREKRTEYLTIRLPAPLRQQLEIIAERLDRSLTDIVLILLRKGLEAGGSEFEQDKLADQKRAPTST